MAKHAGGRPRKELNLDEVEKLYALGCTDDDVAAFFGISRQTIARRKQGKKFAAIIEKGKAVGRVSVRRNLFAAAQKGNAAACIFLAKNLCGMKDMVEVSQSSKAQKDTVPDWIKEAQVAPEAQAQEQPPETVGDIDHSQPSDGSIVISAPGSKAFPVQ